MSKLRFPLFLILLFTIILLSCESKISPDTSEKSKAKNKTEKPTKVSIPKFNQVELDTSILKEEDRAFWVEQYHKIQLLSIEFCTCATEHNRATKSCRQIIIKRNKINDTLDDLRNKYLIQYDNKEVFNKISGVLQSLETAINGCGKEDKD